MAASIISFHMQQTRWTSKSILFCVYLFAFCFSLSSFFIDEKVASTYENELIVQEYMDSAPVFIRIEWQYHLHSVINKSADHSDWIGFYAITRLHLNVVPLKMTRKLCRCTILFRKRILLWQIERKKSTKIA